MKRHLHLVTLFLFILCLLYDVVVWGALPGLPEIGRPIIESAQREAPLASSYIWLGRGVDGVAAPLQAFGIRCLDGALGDGAERIKASPDLAMDILFSDTWNSEHRWFKAMYWGAPCFAFLAAFFWWRRPRKLGAFDKRR